ncbi:MAG: PAS domain S-box protein [Candidatus Promineifilaceae bacterium]|nr:PAS domain S-box protein [Candidatus Promineifilaceae bacterium]
MSDNRGSDSLKGKGENGTERHAVERELEARVQQQAVVARLGQQALASQDLQALMDEAVVRVAVTLNAEYTKILELLPVGSELLLKAGVGWKEEYRIGEATVSAGLESQAGYTLNSADPVVVDDLRTETRFGGPPLLHDHGVVSGISVIVHGVEGPYGVFGAHTTSQREFSRYDVDFLQSVANVIASALQRRNVEETLRASEQRFRGTFENAAVGMAHVARSGKWLRINQRLSEIVGYTRDELYQIDFQTITHPDDLEADLKLYDQLLQGDIPSYQMEKRYFHKEGHVIWIHLTVAPQKNEQGEIEYSIAVIKDITDRKRIEEELRESEARLRELAATLEERVQARTKQVRKLATELTLAEQRERRRIAQMLHDDVQQMLVALQVHLHLAFQNLDGADVAEQRDTLAGHLDEIIDATRNLSVELGSPALRTENLKQGFGWVQSYMKERYGLTVALEIDESSDIADKNLRELIVQLVRELLFNVVKHAKTERASLTVSRNGDDMVIEVEDEGVGFEMDGDLPAPLAAKPQGAGYGLYSVRERLGLFGGRMEVASARGEGTRVRILVPAV